MGLEGRGREMIPKLHGYQEACVRWLESHDEGLLLLDMGLGKSLIVLQALSDMALSGALERPALIVAPLAVARSTWPAELAKWDLPADLSMSVVVGSAARREAALAERADVYVVNRENVAWLSARYPRGGWPFGTLVVDELSGFKNPQSKRWKALKARRAESDRFWGLTGTPAPNGLMDLWAQVYLADRGQRLGRTLGAYRQAFFTPGRRSGYVVYDWRLKAGSAERIYSRISDISVSMRASDELDLPGRVDNVVEADLGDALGRYRDFERDAVAEIGGTTITAASAGVLALKLGQFADGAVYADADSEERGTWREVHRAKLDALRRIVEEAQGEPVLVFYAYRHDLERIQAEFPQARALDAQGEAVGAWNAGEVPILCAHPASCGYGLNLQAGGHTIVWFGLTWDLASYQQANARLDRQGQTSTVVVHHIVAKGTVDERVMRVLEGKARLQDEMMDVVRARGDLR